MTRYSNALAISLLALGIQIVAAASIQGQEPQGPPMPQGPPVVVTSGQAIIKSAPDRAFVTIEAESRARSPRDAQKQNAEAMASVQKQLRELRIPAQAIRTLSYNIQPEYDFRDNKRTLRGYLATNTIEVTLDEIARVGEIVDGAVASGATSVSGVRFDLKNRDAVERQALRDAVADARARAESAAAGAGQSIARVVRIEEQRQGFAPPRPVMMAMRADASEAPQTPIVAGEIEVRANVTLTAQLR